MQYTVKAKQLIHYEYQIEAESEEEARKLLEAAIDDGNSDLWEESDYSEHDGCVDFGIQSVIKTSDGLEIEKPEPPEATPPIPFPEKK